MYVLFISILIFCHYFVIVAIWGCYNESGISRPNKLLNKSARAFVESDMMKSLSLLFNSLNRSNISKAIFVFFFFLRI